MTLIEKLCAVGNTWPIGGVSGNRELLHEAAGRIAQLEFAIQIIGNELSLHADKGPAGEAFRALLNPTFAFPLENEVAK